MFAVGGGKKAKFEFAGFACYTICTIGLQAICVKEFVVENRILGIERVF